MRPNLLFGSELKLKERAESLELEVARRMDERELVRKRAGRCRQAHRLKEAEMDQQIAGLRRKIDELKQKAEQGSVQLQGEVLELTSSNCSGPISSLDSVLEVSEGERSADVSQSVVSATGAHAESSFGKRSDQELSNAWLEKLRDDR
ncbi:MAG: DUF2130 domain-containing protein [Pirellulaceae bacterium]